MRAKVIIHVTCGAGAGVRCTPSPLCVHGRPPQVCQGTLREQVGKEYAEANGRHGPCPQEAFSQFRR